jgi:DinB superfamily
MPETAQEYATRLAGYVQGRDPIAMQRETPAVIARLIEGVTAARLTDRPGPDKWSVAEILMHLAEDELVSTWRYRQMLEHDCPELPGFDQDLWAQLSDYRSWDPADALLMFRLLREANLKLFARLSHGQWERAGVHRERGRLTVRDLCRHMAAHDVNHVHQIRRILDQE